MICSSYTILIAGATAIGPLTASFIVQYSSGTWVDYMWVCVALAGINLVAIFLAYPESNFDRLAPRTLHTTPELELSGNNSDKKSQVVRTETSLRQAVVTVRKPWTSIWKTFITADDDVNLFRTFAQPFIMLFKPGVLLVIFLYGTSLAAQIILM